VGKVAELVIWDTTEIADLVYWQGATHVKQIIASQKI
jgi:imidazolonepropionase-like amidohydrolase